MIILEQYPMGYPRQNNYTLTMEKIPYSGFNH
jgi:hypothetical protein